MLGLGGCLAEPPLLGGESPHVYPIVRLSVCLSVTVALAVVNPGFGDQTLVITSLRSTFRGITPAILLRQFFGSLAMRVVLVSFLSFVPYYLYNTLLLDTEIMTDFLQGFD